MAWQLQGRGGLLRVPDPPSTEPLNEHQRTIIDLSWEDEDTQPGIGPVRQSETLMFPPYVKPEPKDIERTNNLFVYGWCRTGFNLNIAVRRDKGFMGSARTLPEFKMINIDDVRPALVEGGKTAIVGELYVVKTRTIEWLDDAVEDCPGTTSRRIISLEDGTRAHCYVLNRWKIPYREEEIPSGDWAEWKRSERSRLEERKRQAIERMKKSNDDAEARRKALSQSLNGDRAEFTSGYGSRMWDPITQKWKYVPAGQTVYSNDSKTSTDEEWRERIRNASVVSNAPIVKDDKILYKDTRTGKNKVHISDVPMMALRIKLRDGGHDPDGMSDSLVRVECMTRYGMWYDVD